MMHMYFAWLAEHVRHGASLKLRGVNPKPVPTGGKKKKKNNAASKGPKAPNDG